MGQVFFGIDLHKTQFTIHYREENASKGEFGKFPTTAVGYEGLKKIVNEYQESGATISMAVESTGNTRYFKDTVEGWGCRVVVVNPLKMKVITESVKKTDRHDAQTLAEFLEKDMLPEAIICSRESEELRRLLKTRRTLTRTAVSIKNQLHGLLVSIGFESLKGSMQSKRGRQVALATITGSETDSVNGLVAQQLIETIDLLNEQIKKLETTLNGLVKDDETVRLLMTIPGCGIITASTIRAAMDNIDRYSTPKKFAAYAGLVPWVQSSNETSHYGKITKRGPEELRTALVQLVLGMKRSRRTSEFRIMHFYNGKKTTRGTGKSIIATARKLAVIIWTMLKNGDEFSPGKMLDPSLSQKASEMRNAS